MKRRRQMKALMIKSGNVMFEGVENSAFEKK